MPLVIRALGSERMADEVLADFPHGAGELSAFGQDIVERGDEEIHFFFADDEGRKNLDYVHGVTGHLSENAMLAQHLGDDHLGEEHLVDFVEEFPRHFELEFRRLVELDADDEAFAANFLDERMLRAQRIHALDQKRAHSRGVLDELLVIEDFE